MDRTRKRIYLTVLICVVFSAALLAGFVVKLSKPRLLSDREMREYGAMELKTPRRFSDFKLVDHRGEPFTKDDLEGKWSLIFFGFAHCPDVCPTTLSTLSRVYKELDEAEKDDVQVLMISVDPERDTPEKLAEYVPYFHPDFIGVTGDPAHLLALTTQLNVVYNKVPLENGEYTMDHSGNIVVINPKGDYHGFFRPPFEEGSLRVALRSMQYQFEH